MFFVQTYCRCERGSGGFAVHTLPRTRWSLESGPIVKGWAMVMPIMVSGGFQVDGGRMTMDLHRQACTYALCMYVHMASVAPVCLWLPALPISSDRFSAEPSSD